MVYRAIFHARTCNRFPRPRVIPPSIKSLLRRLVCCALLSSLLVLPGDCLPFKEMRVLAQGVEQLTAPALRYLPNILTTLFRRAAGARRRETLADRLAHVAHLQITPRKFVGTKSIQ